MYLKKIPKLVSSTFSKALWKVDNTESIFLTFDDGPHPSSTPKLLSLLSKHDIKASFFCNGDKATEYSDLMDAIRSEGHYIGNHGYHHISGWSTSTSNYIHNAHYADSVIKSKAYRPPYGRITYSQYKTLTKDYQIVMWDVMPGDFDKKVNSKKLLNNLISNTQKGSVIVLHDSLHAVEKLSDVIEEYVNKMQQRKYNFSNLMSVISVN